MTKFEELDKFWQVLTNYDFSSKHFGRSSVQTVLICMLKICVKLASLSSSIKPTCCSSGLDTINDDLSIKADLKLVGIEASFLSQKMTPPHWWIETTFSGVWSVNLDMVSISTSKLQKITRKAVENHLVNLENSWNSTLQKL